MHAVDTGETLLAHDLYRLPQADADRVRALPVCARRVRLAKLGFSEVGCDDAS